jgi:hypothetical protein
MSEPGAAAWPPTSYRRLRSLMRQGTGQRAPGPCAIPGCALAVPDPRPLAPPFVWDHCHAHDYVRGILCRVHNVAMWPVDGQDHAELRRQLAHHRGALVLADLAAYWARCPGCAALGAWQPVMVRHSPGIVARAAELAARAVRTTPGSPGFRGRDPGPAKPN